MEENTEITPARQYDDEGYLIVRTFTAGGFIPIENAKVTVRGGDQNNSTFFYETVTNKNGATEKISLPAPSAELSLNFESIKPYATYTVEINAEKFYTHRDESVVVFAGITSLQSANMIPMAIFRPEDNMPNNFLLNTNGEQAL